MGKKKSSRFSLSNVLPIAWFSKLMTRTERTKTGQSDSSAPCRFPSPCNGGKSMSELSLPRFSVGEKRFGAFDEYLRDGDHEPPRSSCGSCRLSVCAADVPILLSDMLTEAQRSKGGKCTEFPFPEPLVVAFKQNKRDALPELVGVEEEFGKNNSRKVHDGRETVNLNPDCLLKTVHAVHTQSRNRDRSGTGYSNRSSLPLPEGTCRGRLEAHESKVEDFSGACPVFTPEGDVCKTKKGETQSAACTKINALVRGVPSSTSKASSSVKDSVQFQERKVTVLDERGMGCSGSDRRPAQKCKSFVAETFRVFPEKELNLFDNADTRKGTEEITMRCMDTRSQLSSGKPGRFPSLHSVLFPETECTKTVQSFEVERSQSEFVKNADNKLKGAESSFHKKMGWEVRIMKDIGEANNFIGEKHSSSEAKNRHAFTESGSRPSHQHQMRRSGPEVDATHRRLEDFRPTDSSTFLDKETARNTCEVKEAIEIVKNNVQSVKVKSEHVPMTRGRAIGVRKEACEAQLLSRAGGHDTPRRKSFRVRQKARNRKALECDTDLLPNETEESQKEDSEEDLELKISKILGFNPGKINEEGAKFRSRYSDQHQNSTCKKKQASANRYSPSDTTIRSNKTPDGKIEKDNDFRSLLLHKLDRKRSAVLLQNSTTLQTPQKEPRPEVSSKTKQRTKIRVSSPRVEIRPRKSFQGDRKKKEREVTASFAVVKRSIDPQEDFRESMVEMISENQIAQPEELENLLASYLSLNSNEHHDVIVKAFRQVWFDLSRACVVSDYLDLEGNRRV